MDPKRVTEIEQLLTNRHDMLHYNMRALRRAGLDLLAEMRNKEQQLRMAAKEAAKGCCPYDANKAFALICKEDCSDDDTRSERCWLEYWRCKSGTFQNGNNHGTTSKTETVGEGAE